MKRCTKEHTVESFGTIPVGSLWADDSPYLVVFDNFVDADAPAEPDEAPPTPAPVKATRKRKES